jgi:hypothetical protein
MWGMYGDKEPCGHLLALHQFLIENEMEIYGEGTEDPSGWVNVHCERCNRTYEVTLMDPWETGEEECD